MLQCQKATILLVDDDEVDIMSVKRALKKNAIDNPLVVANNGIEALECLRGQGGRVRVAAPYVILLDLNMPRMDGFEFLEQLRRDPLLARSIVFVFTTSNACQDKARTYDFNIAGYMLKSYSGRAFQSAVQLIDFYCKIVEAPYATRKL